MTKGPPYKTGLPYFKRSFERWCGVHRPTWSRDNVLWTAMTLWNGDPVIQNYFIKRVGKKYEYAMQRDHQVPAVPWNRGDADTAKRTGVLPVAVAPAVAPAVPPAVPSAIPPAMPPFQVPPPPMPPLPPPPPPPPTTYPFNFWPNTPWFPNPTIDRSIGPGLTIGAIRKNENGARDRWIATKPFMWPPQNEDDWGNKRFLGAGTYGCAGLWCQRDEYNNITSHLVVKEARARKLQWRDPCFWRDQLPREIRMHQLVDHNRMTPDHDTLVEHQGHRLMMTQQRYRIFLNYYEGGDLWHALQKHMIRIGEMYNKDGQYKDRGMVWDKDYYCYRNPHKASGEPGLYRKIPEGLIWEIASSLVQACQILHFGQVGQGGVQDVVPGWKPIKHCDIRLDNIFLQPAANKKEYPMFVLADFGLSFTDLGAPGTDNPQEYVMETMDERYAPELHHVMPDVPAGAAPLSLDEKTDVWQIGAILYTLLSNGVYPGPNCGPCRGAINMDMVAPAIAGKYGDLGSMTDPEYDPWGDMDYFPTFIRYSDELKRLAKECLEWNPNKRLTLIDMRTSIDDFLITHPNIAADRNIESLVVGREDEFAIGKPFD